VNHRATHHHHTSLLSHHHSDRNHHHSSYAHNHNWDHWDHHHHHHHGGWGWDDGYVAYDPGWPYYSSYYRPYGYDYGDYYYNPSYNYYSTPSYNSYQEPVPRYTGGYSNSVVANVQDALSRAGYYDSSVDGVLGPRTSDAISNYQADNGLPVTGRIDNALLDSLGTSS